MPALGFRIHPNTDDPTLHQVNPTLTWWMMMRDFGFQLDDLRQFMLNGIDGAWVDASVQSQWRQSFSSYFDEHRPDVPIQKA
jgi:adenosine deaminase